MIDRRSDDDARFEVLSALADGEASAAEVARACGAWKEDAHARLRWSTYQLIGDAMRSDELVGTRQSQRFLKSFHERLALEPVVLAPAGLSARHEPTVVDVSVPAIEQAPLRRRMWAGPMAVAACFVMVVGALVASQGQLEGDSSSTFHTAQSSAAAPLTVALAPPSLSANAFVGNEQPEGTSFTHVGGPGTLAASPLWRDPALEQWSQTGRLERGEASFAAHGEVLSGGAMVRNVGFPTP